MPRVHPPGHISPKEELAIFQNGHLTRRGAVFTGVVIIAVTAATLLAMGRTLICKCGTIELWHPNAFDSGSSQHIADWYTPSHMIHGVLFFAILWLVARRWPLRVRALVAILVESGWEILENSDFIINRYRETTIALDYFGDSVLNSVSDIAFMLLGFFLTARLPVWVTVSLAIAAEIVAAIVIRDNLTLNIIMLIYPLDWVLAWQSAL